MPPFFSINLVERVDGTVTQGIVYIATGPSGTFRIPGRFDIALSHAHRRHVEKRVTPWRRALPQAFPQDNGGVIGAKAEATSRIVHRRRCHDPFWSVPRRLRRLTPRVMPGGRRAG